jgi:hypothetical protein
VCESLPGHSQTFATRCQGVLNGSQIASLGKNLLAIRETDQIAGGSQIASLARSPRNNSRAAQITLHYVVLFLLFLSPV